MKFQINPVTFFKRHLRKLLYIGFTKKATVYGSHYCMWIYLPLITDDHVINPLISLLLYHVKIIALVINIALSYKLISLKGLLYSVLYRKAVDGIVQILSYHLPIVQPIS